MSGDWTIPHLTPLRGRFTHEVDGRSSRSTALTTAIGLRLRWCESTVSVRARPPVFLNYLPKKRKHGSKRGRPGFLAGAVYCNRTATRPERSRTEQDRHNNESTENTINKPVSLTD